MAMTIGGPPDQRPALAQAREALERGEGAQAATLLNRALREPGLTREDSLLLRCALAEAWLLQDELKHAADALGRPPDELRERIEPARISALWRLHGRITAARGEPSRAIAQLGKALKAAERAHDSQAIGLAHYELGLCYRRVGDTAIVREHLNKAASALHAAGDRRHLALVHSLSGVILATQDGRIDEAMSALRRAERLAALARANDVVAIVCNNQANVALLQNRYEQALALAERSVSLQAETGSPHGLGVSLASLGQICVRGGKLERAEQVLRRALDVRSAVQFLRETRGAVYDTLTQIHLIRGEYHLANTCLMQARDAYGEYGTQTSKWYEWSIRVLEARLALRRGRLDEALALATETAQSPAAPPADALQAALIASEAVLVAGRVTEAAERIAALGHRLQPAGMPSLWGEYLRLRGRLHAREGRTTEAYHDLGQSVSVFELFGERYEAGLSYLALGELAADAGARSRATRYLADAAASFEALGAGPDLAAARAALARVPVAGTGEYIGPQVDGDDVIVRRLVDA
ncbi:MAG: tetratricopeptide repeat protein, partial [bacterium]